ncbi:MAG TPA: ATP synthase F0 subunit C [Capsulimonadaceae bacterium]|jgi:F-type H+-transporting ATPase subunit c
MAAIYFGLLALGAALAAPLAAIGVAIAEGMVFSTAIQSIARQPEADGKIRTLMFICFGLVETLFIFGFVIFIMLLGKLPSGTAESVATMLSGK